MCTIAFTGFVLLIEQAPDFDLICLAGDLLEMLRSETRMEQAREIRTLVKELADVVPVAVCSSQKVPKSFSAVWRRNHEIRQRWKRR
jgi:hypothetical protein